MGKTKTPGAKRRKPAARCVPERFAADTVVIAREAENAAERIEAAKTVLEEFVHAVRLAPARAKSLPIDRDIALYIAGALERIIASESVDARAALGIKTSSAGRRKGTAKCPPEVIAAAFHLLMRNGLRQVEARGRIADAIGADESTVRRAVAAYKLMGDRDQYGDELLKSMAQPVAAKIRVILASLRRR